MILNIINEISAKINYHKNTLFNSEIMLKINQTGMSNIMYRGISNNNPCPSKIYLNEVIQALTDCTKINITQPESIIKLIWDDPLNSINCLFCGCYNIIEIKFLNFDTSSLTDMSLIFQYCNSLTSVDLSNLNITSVNSISGMFNHCDSLKFINLSNFDTSKITNMEHLFYNCINLEYINLFNFTDINNPLTENMFTGIKKNAVICIDKNKAPSIYNFVDNMPCVSISCRPD